jgi:hypothetical protein
MKTIDITFQDSTAEAREIIRFLESDNTTKNLSYGYGLHGYHIECNASEENVLILTLKYKIKIDKI